MCRYKKNWAPPMIRAYVHACAIDRSINCSRDRDRVHKRTVVRSLFLVSSFIYHTQIVICLNQAWSGGMAMDKSLDPTCICMCFFLYMPSLILLVYIKVKKRYRAISKIVCVFIQPSYV